MIIGHANSLTQALPLKEAFRFAGRLTRRCSCLGHSPRPIHVALGGLIILSGLRCQPLRKFEGGAKMITGPISEI